MYPIIMIIMLYRSARNLFFDVQPTCAGALVSMLQDWALLMTECCCLLPNCRKLLREVFIKKDLLREVCLGWAFELVFRWALNGPDMELTSTEAVEMEPTFVREGTELQVLHKRTEAEGICSLLALKDVSGQQLNPFAFTAQNLNVLPTLLLRFHVSFQTSGGQIVRTYICI